MNFLKTWLIANITPFLKAIKSAISTAKTEAIASAKTYTDQEIATLANTIGSITGSYKGAFTTKTAMDAVTAKVGDWAILSTDDGANESGIYVKGSGGFTFVLDIAAFSEIRTEILASDAEFSTGTSTDKTATVKQIKDALNQLSSAAVVATATTNQDWIAGIETPDTSKFLNSNDDSKVTTVGYVRLVFQSIVYALAGKATKQGDETQKFLVADASVNTKEAVNASQFDFTITDAEAQNAWDNINNGPTYNFDVTADWASKSVTDKASFESYLVNSSLNISATVTDFSLVGNRLRANITNSPNIFLNNMSLESANFKVPNPTSGTLMLDISGNSLNQTNIDLIAAFSIVNLSSLKSWNSTGNDVPSSNNKLDIENLCTANGGSATFQ